MGLLELPREEFLYIDTWEKLSRQTGPPFVFADGYEVDSLFKAEAPNPPHPDGTILVTACYDAGPTYQSEEHPARDLLKHLYCVDWEGLSRNQAQYHRVQIGPAVREGRCHPLDKYSIKTDRYTWGTFQDIPEWVSSWWTVNANIDDPRVKCLPFGLNTDGPGASYIPEYQGRDKTGLLYVNFQHNSKTRLDLKEFWQGQLWATYRPDPNLPVRTYLEELSAHKFVLAPAGNGLDQYRVLEAIYLGTVPILEDSRWARKLKATGIPVVVLPNLFRITPTLLESLWEHCLSREWNYDWVRLSNWKKTFRESASRPGPTG